MWKKIKTWFLKNCVVVKGWFIKNWLLIMSYVVIFLSYSITYGYDDVVFANVLLGLWLFISIGYAGYNWFKSKNS